MSASGNKLMEARMKGEGGERGLVQWGRISDEGEASDPVCDIF